MSRLTDSDVTLTLSSDTVAILGALVLDAAPRLKPEAQREMGRLAGQMMGAIQSGKAQIINAYGSPDAANAAAASHLEAHPWVEDPWL